VVTRTAPSAARVGTPAPLPRALLDDLSMLATTRPAGATSPTSVEAFVDELLARPELGEEVAPRLVVGPGAMNTSAELSDFWVLKKTDSTLGPVYYLREPCSPAKAEKVHPWWDLASTVLVCPDSHQPTRLVGEKGWRCGSHAMNPMRSDYCGCGPNLATCQRDRAQYDELVQSLQREVRATVADVVRRDLPLERVFSRQETVRDRMAETAYQRWRVLAGEIAQMPDLSAWPKDGVLAPRVESFEGQHAGVLTTPQMVMNSDVPRARLRDLYAIMWCQDPGSINVETETILSLGATDLRLGDGWRKLAAMPVCTNCHARLDYGMQFFPGFPTMYNAPGPVPVPASATADGPFYGRDIDDLRATTKRTPRDFMRVAVKQREFEQCMVRRVTDHVFGGAPPPEAKAEVLAALRERGTLRAMMRVALLGLAKRWTASEKGPHDEAQQRAQAQGGKDSPTVGIDAPLRARLDASCTHCHAKEGSDFRPSELPRPLVGKMLGEVAFGRMPKDFVGMPQEERTALVTGLATALFPDAERRAVALRFFTRADRPPPAHWPVAARQAIAQRSGGTSADAPFGDTGERYTPDFVISGAFQALQACEAAKLQGDARRDCIRRATSPEDLIVGPGR
jgi:hypothetical protein